MKNKPIAKIIWQVDGMFATHLFEGPVLSPDGSRLYFSDVRDERIYEIETAKLTNLPVKPKCICQGGGEINGLAFRGNNELLGCRMSKPTGLVKIDLATGKPTSLVCTFNSKSLNGPNDLVWDDKSGKVFFTDPKMPANILNKKERLFSFDNTMNEPISCDELERPNGVAIKQNKGNENSLLFVAESDADKVLKYEIDSSGNLSSPDDFVTGLDSPVDGMALGPNGYLYVTSDKKIRVFDPNGNELPYAIDCFWKDHRVRPSNLCFLRDDRMIVTSYNLFRGTSKLFLVVI